MEKQSSAVDPAGSADVLLRLGNDLMDRGETTSAIEAYRTLVSSVPEFGPAYRNLALALESAGRFDEAVLVCSQAIERQSDDLESYLVMAGLLLRLERTDEAVRLYRFAIMAAPGRPDIVASLAAALTRSGALDEAEQVCRTAIALSPQYAGAHLNLGVVLSRRDDLEGAASAFRTAIGLAPDAPEGFTNLGATLSDLGRGDAALEASARAVALRPDDPVLRYNHAVLLLLAGQLVSGFREFEARLAHPDPRFRPRAFEAPRWNGEPRHGRTLLIHAEQGLGDTLHFARFVPWAAATGGPVVLMVQPPLVRLLQDSLQDHPGVAVISRDAPLPSFDLHVPMMSLPHVQGTTIETIPDRPYLMAAPAKADAWRLRLGVCATLKVGIVWSGNPSHRQDGKRSLAAAAVLPRLLGPGVKLFSLQKDVRADDRAVLAQLEGQVCNLAPQLADFADTAAVISAMDLVISVDTAVAHLASALGKPTWILLPYVLDWRWLYERSDSPWYPTARLFRQPRPGDWAGALDALVVELQRAAAERGRAISR
jgi:tetratricopeptide (TPR) repeat protein